MSGPLAGKVALITGGGQGVGRGIALSLAKAGADIALTGRTFAKLDAVAEEVRALGRRVVALECDVKNAASIEASVAATVAQLGGLDILVNNAQEVTLGTIMDTPDDAFQAMFDSGPLATVRGMRAAYPHLKRSGEAVIVNLSTSATRRWDMGNHGGYGAVKRAVEALTRAAAAEWGPDGIRVLAIAPHADSPALNAWMKARPDEAEKFFRTIPLGRIGKCEDDIGEAVAALCTPAFKYMTSVIIPLDGGQANFA